MKRILLPLVLATSPLFAIANEDISTQGPKISGVYIGAGFGTFGYSEEDSWGYNSNEISAKADGNSTKIYLGYQFNKIVGIRRDLY